MLVPLTAIVTTSLPMAAAIVLCAKDRATVHANKKKGSASGKSSKSARGGKSSKSASKKGHSSSRRSKSRRSSKSGRSSKKSGSKKSKKDKKKKPSGAAAAAKAPGASEKSEKSQKSGKSSKSSRKSKSSKSSKTRRLDSDAQKKMEKSGKSISKSAEVVEKSGEAAEKSLKEEMAAITHSTQMSVAPARLQYPVIGGVSTIEIKNNSDERKAIKVKCSDNALYRVNPVHGFAEPRSSIKVDVMRLNGEEKTDKLVFLVTGAKDAAEPREAFATGREHREMMVVPLSAS